LTINWVELDQVDIADKTLRKKSGRKGETWKTPLRALMANVTDSDTFRSTSGGWSGGGRKMGFAPNLSQAQAPLKSPSAFKIYKTSISSFQENWPATTSITPRLLVQSTRSWACSEALVKVNRTNYRTSL
jgi:hypothetical protein